MTPIKTLSSIFNVHPGEGKIVMLLLAHSFFGGITLSFLLTTASAMYLAHFNVATLPYVYLLNAVIVSSIGFIISKIEERISASTFFIGTLIALMLFIAALRLSLWLPYAHWLIFGFMIWFKLVHTSLGLEFWGLAARLFTIRQGKRLFGLIGAGDFTAKIFGGFSVPFIVPFIGTPNLLLIALGGLACSLVILLIILRYMPQRLNERQEENITETGSKVNPLRERYVLLIFVMFIISISSNYFIDYVFFGQTQIRYQSQDELARFLGVFFGTIQLAVLLISTFISGRLISRYGIKLGLLTLPVIFTISMVLVAVTGTAIGPAGIFFWFVVLAKICEDTLRWPFEQPSLRVLYTPIPSERRLASQVVVEGRGNPLGAGFAGVCLLIFIWLKFPTVIPFTYFMVGLFLIWIVFVIQVYREYISVLMQALKKQDIGDMSLLTADNSTEAVLKEGLSSPHIGVVTYSLDKLEELEPGSFPAILVELLQHPTAEIRLDVLRRIEQRGISSAIPVIKQRIPYEASVSVRGASVRTLAALAGPEAFDELLSNIESSDRPIKLGTLVGLLRNGELEGILLAGEKLLELVNAPESSDRELAAQVLGEGGIRSFYRPVLKLLRDIEPPVQRAALIAASKLRHPRLWPVVMECLGSPGVHTTAIKALTAGGESVLPELQAGFMQERQDRKVLIRIARVCGRIQGGKAIVLLRGQLDCPDGQVRSAILMALSQCHYHAEDNQQNRIQSQIGAEVEHIAQILTIQADIEDGDTVLLLRSALETHVTQAIERIFLLLSFCYDSPSILRVREHFLHAPNADGSEEKKAYALEILDVLLPSDLKKLLLPLFDDRDSVKRLKALSKMFPQRHRTCSQHLQALIEEDDSWKTPWVRSCAFAAAVRLDITAIIKKMNTGREGGMLMLATVEKVMQLKAVNFFSETPEEILMELSALLEEVALQPGEKLIEKGEIGHAMYLIVNGQIRVQGGNHHETTLGKGEVLGELSLLDPAPYAVSVTALMTTHVLRLEQQPFLELIEEHSTVARHIMQILVRQLRHAQVKAAPGKPQGEVLSDLYDKLTEC